MDYSALIIDIKKSKSYGIDMRNEVQAYLTKSINLLNHLYDNMMLRHVTFSAGDELQGLFNNPVTAVLYWRMLEFMLYPVQIRAGIGVGEWNIRIEGGTSSAQDGPAFHNARSAIEEVQKKQMQTIRINSRTEKDVFTNYLLNNSVGYKIGQNYIQNILQLVCEIMYPFNETDKFCDMDCCAIEIIELKDNYKVAGNKFSDVVREKTDFHSRETIGITGNITEVEEVIFRKGMNSMIADVMHKSRQNIDTVMKRGNIQRIRSMDYMALQYIKKNYGGENV